jgi:hypothetical protein
LVEPAGILPTRGRIYPRTFEFLVSDVESAGDRWIFVMGHALQNLTVCNKMGILGDLGYLIFAKWALLIPICRFSICPDALFTSFRHSLVSVTRTAPLDRIPGNWRRRGLRVEREGRIGNQDRGYDRESDEKEGRGLRREAG